MIKVSQIKKSNKLSENKKIIFIIKLIYKTIIIITTQTL